MLWIVKSYNKKILFSFFSLSTNTIFAEAQPRNNRRSGRILQSKHIVHYGSSLSRPHNRSRTIHLRLSPSYSSPTSFPHLQFSHHHTYDFNFSQLEVASSFHFAHKTHPLIKSVVISSLRSSFHLRHHLHKLYLNDSRTLQERTLLYRPCYDLGWILIYDTFILHFQVKCKCTSP